MTIRCPHCGSPVRIRGSRWECGYCGDFGNISSLHPSEKAKLMQAATPTIQVTVTVTDSSEEEPPRRFSRAELEDMVRRWDFDENEWACRDLLIATFPEAVSLWSEKELAEMDTMDLLVETGRREPETALEMAKLLLNTAEEHLQDKEVASQLLNWDMYDLLVSDDILPLLVEELKQDDRLAHQLFQRAYVDRPQEAILNACGRLGEKELQRKLLELLDCNPFPHDEIELESDEE
ncbi:hypothetical protein [Neglectibacter timonensis]|uniref:hypothetical protein n=1 Tax=Neglectibacter timonensis TaxID=1776382 RepID=UPI0039957CB9